MSNHILDYLKIYNYNDKKRLGVSYDGGYIIGILNGTYDFYISAGVSNEESFSRDFIDLYNLNRNNCAAFDGTITNYPYQYTKRIFFYKRNISKHEDANNSNLTYFTSYCNDIFLKMDIEGSEYEWILSLTTDQIKKFKQIVIEFHGINDDSWGINLTDKIECLRKLTETHYPIHIHGNNHGPLTENIPDTIEVTYVRKDLFENEPNLNVNPLPFHGLDFPNNELKEDYDLNFPPFVN
jgi:hypothetical protein